MAARKNPRNSNTGNGQHMLDNTQAIAVPADPGSRFGFHITGALGALTEMGLWGNQQKQTRTPSRRTTNTRGQNKSA